jgi:putative DNA primase/helicase
MSDDHAEAREEFEQQAHEPPPDLNAAVAALARLKPLEYDRIRQAEAERLGVRIGTLDAEVRKGRGNGEADPEALVETVEPWGEPVDGAELLAEVARLFARHVVLPEGAATALALWVLGTYAYDAFRVWPRLALLSPVKRCGKTTAIEALGATCCRPLVASNITPAALFRTIQDWHPTLLIDEGDTFARDNEELRGIVNSGHTRAGAFVIRTVGEEHTPRKFSTWAPLAIAAIGHLPGTIMDRSVIVRLRRKGPGERADKLALEVAHDCLGLRQRAARWAEDHSEALRAARPKLPPSTNDRALDNWGPLFAIAERAGADWPARAQEAFRALASEEDEDGAGTLLLGDIRDLFTLRGTDRLPSADLAEHLGKLEERPWPEWKHGKPITARQVAALLRPFKIAPDTRRVGGGTFKGYLREQFADAWHRYLPEPPPFDPSHGHNLSGARVSADFDRSHADPPVTDRNPLKARQDAGCDRVTDREGEGQGGNGADPDEGWVGGPHQQDLPEVIDL